MKVLILGAGLIGCPMAVDLASDNLFQVAVADISEENLNKIPKDLRITKIKQDLSDKNGLKALLENYDFVLNALPGFMGFDTLKQVIELGKNIVDISFFSEDPFELDQVAIANNVTAVVDCGVAPGMSNLLAAHVDTIMDKTESILIYVGGLPKIREYPYEYKAGFSPMDVIEEYTRLARYVEDGKMVVRPALSDSEYINFPEVGTLEAFNSDGLRTLAFTLKVPNMKEKTLRYPGHIEKMLQLREAGFFSKKEVGINGKLIRPIDFTSKLLFPLWELKEGDTDFTIMKIIIEGEKEKKKLRYSYDLYDVYDEDTKVHSMARTTGYTATTILRMLVNNNFNRKGISPPEYIGQDPSCFEYVISGLKKHGIIYKELIESLD